MRSVGVLLYRRAPQLEVFLVHPGGPYFAKKDDGAWGVPKGQVEDGEDLLAAAKREFVEETGFLLPEGDYLPLAPVRLPSGKIVQAWAAEGDGDPAALVSNTCTIEWPPRSGKQLEIPEIDRGAWFSVDEALRKVKAGYDGLIRELVERLA